MATPPQQSSSGSELSETPPGATDHLEQTAAEVARQKGHTQVTDEDRQGAYEQMRKTAPPAKSSPPTPEES